MSSSLGVISNLGILAPAVERRTAQYDQIYQEHCHRIYSLSFWMTDNELTAEQLAGNTFLRAFALSVVPGDEQIDQAFLAEIREMTQVGTLILNSSVCPATKSVCGNVKRIHLERAVVDRRPDPDRRRIHRACRTRRTRKAKRLQRARLGAEFLRFARASVPHRRTKRARL